MEFEQGFIIGLTHNVCHLENNRNLINFLRFKLKLQLPLELTLNLDKNSTRRAQVI